MTPQTILITGGTGKFGRNFVSHFSKKNWTVLFTSTSEERVDELLASLGEPSNVFGFVSNLMEPTSIEELTSQVNNKEFCVNHIVNNARSLKFLKADQKGQTGRDDFLQEYLLDVVVPYELSMAFYKNNPLDLKTIINISSQYGVVAANPNLYDDYLTQSPIQYSVAKAALGHLTKELAVRFAINDIRVNCIAYGGVDGRVDDEFKKRYARLTPSARMLSEQELVGPLEFLVSDQSSSMNGHTLVADGGWSIW